MRVMRILTRPNLGGPTRQAVALWHAHAALGVRTLLVTGRVDDAEPDLSPAAAGVPRLTFADAIARGPAAEGWVEVSVLGRGITPWRDRQARLAIVSLLRACRPDVVHTHTSKAGWLGRRAAAAVGIPRIVHTFHGHVLKDYFGAIVSWGLARVEQHLAKKTSALIAVSGSCADELAAAGIARRERFAVVPPAVSLPVIASRSAARAELGIAEPDLRAVCVGRLVPIKRTSHFVRAIAACPEWRGDIFGAGPLREQLADEVGRIAAARVLLRGADADIVRRLSAYDALVLPSVREGCPLVAIEAFAAGIPVIGYDVPGVRDALRDWGRGILVPEREGPAGLAAAMRRLAADPLLRRECVTAGMASVARFSPEAVARALLAIYRGEQN